MSEQKLGQPVPGRTRRFVETLKAREDWKKNQYRSPRFVNYVTAFNGEFAKLPLPRRVAASFAHAIANEPVILFEGEQLAGQYYRHLEPLSPELEQDSALAKTSFIAYDAEGSGHLEALAVAQERYPELLALSGEGDTTPEWGKYAGIHLFRCSGGHIGWHWDWVVEGGVESVFRRIEAAWGKVDAKGREFLDCARISLEGFLRWTDRHVAALREKLAAASVPEERVRLQRLAEACERVPRHGARNFREALQSYHLTYIAGIYEMSYGGNGPGRFDYYLWPYLERDLATGAETLESARELVDELFLRQHDRLWFGDGCVETIVVGGCGPDGRSSINPLSRIVVESICGLNVTHPSVYMRVPPDAPEDWWELAARYLKDGENRAQILNDAAIVKAMSENGVKVEDARMYMCGGCMELSPHGMNGDLLFASFFNVGKILELVLNGGVCLNTGKNLLPRLNGRGLADFKSFDELYAAFEGELARQLRHTFQNMDEWSRIWAERRPGFYVSSMVDDCVERGRGINDGGARYEDFGSTPLSIPNVADSLVAIKAAVFDQRFVSAPDMLAALRSDFKDAEPLRLRLLSLPKYGQGDAAADQIMDRVVKDVCDIYASYTNRVGGRIKPMIMTFMMASVAGAALGATADGRKAGTPVAQGITPQNASMTKGLGTAMRSAGDVDISRFSGGASHMWDIDPDFATATNLETVLKTFFSLGGQMFQGNTTDVEALVKAMRTPEQYQGLTVRVGGFSAFFVKMAKPWQEELVNRRRHTAA